MYALGRLDSRTGNQRGQSGSCTAEPAVPSVTDRRPAELRVNQLEESPSAPSNMEDNPPSYSQLYPTDTTEFHTSSIEIGV